GVSLSVGCSHVRVGFYLHLPGSSRRTGRCGGAAFCPGGADLPASQVPSRRVAGACGGGGGGEEGRISSRRRRGGGGGGGGGEPGGAAGRRFARVVQTSQPPRFRAGGSQGRAGAAGAGRRGEFHHGGGAGCRSQAREPIRSGLSGRAMFHLRVCACWVLLLAG